MPFPGVLFNLFYIIMFSTIGLFKQIGCPEQPQCLLPSCVFAHEVSSQPSNAGNSSPDSATTSFVRHEEQKLPDGRRKRRRLNSSNDRDSKDANSESLDGGLERIDVAVPRTASRPISPPPLRHLKEREDRSISRDNIHNLNATKTSALSHPVTVTLNPRLLPNPPATHAVRMQLIKMLHDHMSRLNEEIRQGEHPFKESLKLSREELIMVALSEEEAAAKDNPTVYANVIKLRIVKLKKMKVFEWEEGRLKQIAKEKKLSVPIALKSEPKIIQTGLKQSQEIALLPRLMAEQIGLAKYGYIPEAPSVEEVAQARQGVEAAKGWEQCDRCRTRFQVFPGRREVDGALTSGGQCTYHPVRPRRPTPKDKADRVSKEPMFACCNENVGTSSGCTQAPSHVFKVSDSKRLALIMPFEQTSEKPLTPQLHQAICFDCEMGYTTLGLELIRLTATSWPSGDEVIDVLVRPLGEILDLNSRFSGVWPSDFNNALPYSKGSEVENVPTGDNSEPAEKLRIVATPAEARELLFSLLTPETPLIGHALDNDLNATRIIHPSIVDTVLLYPHPRGLPIRFGLKVLMKKHLDRDIQMAGAAGHDSKEDARAAGDLVRLKVAETWNKMRREGWTVRKDEFLPPVLDQSTKDKPSGNHTAEARPKK